MTEIAPTLSPAPLMQITSGFWAFKTLAAAEELGLFARLAGGREVTSAEFARALGIHHRPAEMLLTGCASLGLLEVTNGRYRNSAVADEFLVRGKPYYFGGWIRMCDKRLYPGWGRLTEAIRTNRPTTWNPEKQRSLFEGEDPVVLELFWEAMHSLSTYSARALARAVDLSDVRRLLDVGGGSGAYPIELCGMYPHLRATVYDLPFVAGIATSKVAAAELCHRIETLAGDFLSEEPLPDEHDAVLLSMILHDWDEVKCRGILKKCFDALPPGGMVIISELLVNDEKAGPAPAALMSLNMLIETEGRNYTPSEYSAWLREAGFTSIKTVWFNAAGANGAVIARRG
jgi:precorrin-6B methylase 2